MPPSSPQESPPRWAGYWRVLRYNGTRPKPPTYYDASLTSWDVLTETSPSTLSVARHPILDIRDNILVLKDEGEPDENTEQWEIDLENERLRVTALTGPHEGATGLAERIDENPRESFA
ncbi:hypothetical protein BSZ35_09015 [Salinibacter sp. 10B]|uniref:hypothetical protein n=1 Tax=Salinibacter sp. 10B TaxID=1923971 RepID=UPI000CF578B2|nr:hypothetical protein [Salinibacter sp. 10B]PQJ34721.1 hypothetical protein BSZ35_09015 [Salinibacter sp. 10B]